MNDTIKPYMTTWDLVRCADYHFRRTIYGLGPYIADYPEQSTAAGTVYGWCVTSVSFPASHHVILTPSLGVMLILLTSMDLLPNFAHSPNSWRSLNLRMMTPCGLAMALYLTSWWVPCHHLFSTADQHLQPFTTKFPRADIYELLTPDLLHQAIKGTFKDHLVTWVEEYLKLVHGASRGLEILDEIDRRFTFILH